MEEIIARFWLFWPQIMVLSCIAVLVFLFFKLIIWKIGKDNLESAEWFNNNKKKSLVLYFVFLFLWAPIFEELIFRMPLIIFFDSLSNVSWIFIILSSILFALMHQKNFILLATFILGIVAGCVGIKYQSLYYTSFAHFAWNFFVGTGLLQLILIFIIFGPIFLYQFISDKWTSYKFKKKLKKRTAEIEAINKNKESFKDVLGIRSIGPMSYSNMAELELVKEDGKINEK